MDQQDLITILKASFDAGLLVAPDGCILYVNTSARDFLALRNPEEVSVEEALVFVDPHDNHTWVSWLELTTSLREDERFLVIPNRLYQQEEQHDYSIAPTTAEARLAVVNNYTMLFLHPQDESSSLAPSVLAGILDAALDPLFQIDEHGTIHLCNKAATTQFGWTKEEFIGSNINMIVGTEHASKHDGYIKRYLETGETRVMGTKRELPARRKDGSEFVIMLSLVEVDVPVEHGNERMFCGFILDLTQQKQLIGKIETERNLVKGILDASLDPLFQIDERGIIHLVNSAATKQFGWTREEFMGSNISMIVGGEHARKHDQYIKRYLRTGETRVMGTKRILPARRKDGSELTIQLSLVEVDVPVEHGEERMFCGFVLDVTDQQVLQGWMESFPGIRNRV